MRSLLHRLSANALLAVLVALGGWLLVGLGLMLEPELPFAQALGFEHKPAVESTIRVLPRSHAASGVPGGRIPGTGPGELAFGQKPKTANSTWPPSTAASDVEANHQKARKMMEDLRQARAEFTAANPASAAELLAAVPASASAAPPESRASSGWHMEPKDASRATRDSQPKGESRVRRTFMGIGAGLLVRYFPNFPTAAAAVISMSLEFLGWALIAGSLPLLGYLTFRKDGGQRSAEA